MQPAFPSISLLIALLAVFPASPGVTAGAPVEPVVIRRHSVPVKYENVVETVIIDSTRFQVPKPWAGNRLFPTTRNLDELRQIPVESTYQGSELYVLAEAYPSMMRMLDQARRDGVELTVESAYRSIHYQTRIFMRMLEDGRSFEDVIRYVAPPGYSQHMLGTALDFYPSNWAFAETEQYVWLQDNAWRYGFEETYSEYNRFKMPWEAWHWNYTGVPENAPESLAERFTPETGREISN